MSQLHPYSHLNFTCDNCQEKFYNKTAYSPIKNAHPSEQIITYCSNCVIEEKPNQKRTKSKTKNDKRITGRTKQLNLKVKEEIYWLLKRMAVKEKKLMTEMLEKLLRFYKNNRKG